MSVMIHASIREIPEASALHKLGYDEITLVYSKPKLNDVVQDLIKNLLLGFIVIEQTSKKTVLKNIANEVESEFNNTLRRAFLVTNSLASSSLDMISSTQFSSLKSLINLEMSNNQLTSFCLRLINKGFYKEPDKQLFITTIIWNLEKIADEYKSICNNLSMNNYEISKDILDLYKEVNSFFNDYYELMYKFSIEKVNSLVDRKEELFNKLNNINTRNKLIIINPFFILLLSELRSRPQNLNSQIRRFFIASSRIKLLKSFYKFLYLPKY